MSSSIPMRVSFEFKDTVNKEKKKMENKGIDISIPAITKIIAREWDEKNSKKSLLSMIELDFKRNKIRL